MSKIEIKNREPLFIFDALAAAAGLVASKFNDSSIRINAPQLSTDLATEKIQRDRLPPNQGVKTIIQWTFQK